MTSNLRIKISAIDTDKIPTQGQILTEITKVDNEIRIIDIIPVNGGAVVQVADRKFIYKLLEKDSVDTLKTVNLRPIKPSWLSPSRTLFVNRMPKAFEDYTNEEILIEAKEKTRISKSQRLS